MQKICFTFIVLGILWTGQSCHNHKESDTHQHDTAGHNHGDGESEPENHEKEKQTIASLTEAQIKTVGIRYSTIEYKELTATMKANGVLKVPNNNKANATSLYAGVVKNLHVQLGSVVKIGQAIATISNPQFIQTQEEYLTLESKISFAEQELKRQKELNDGNAGAGKNLQSAETELKSLTTRKASLHQQIWLMGINPNSVGINNLKSTLLVTSPINGTISNVFAKIGSYADVSSPIVEIVDNQQMHLDLNVFEKDLPLLRIGQIIHFTLTNNPIQEYDAHIYSIGTAFENDTKTIPVHCTIKGKKTGLIDGMNITAIVSLDKATTPAVPNEAIVEADGKYYIFVITDKHPEEHDEHEEEGHEGHNHDEADHMAKTQGTTSFEKIEVAKGVSNVGYTAITPLTDIGKDTKIVTQGAFFINAKMSNTSGHVH